MENIFDKVISNIFYMNFLIKSSRGIKVEEDRIGIENKYDQTLKVSHFSNSVILNKTI